ncbi:hypothetical protein [Fusobacterium perfoetens]|uniref:hypothetical protein n=1 Tax=Fusobacterium perfoetens TaxID=852 RepID=UPI001F31C3ED|nr:hypothetical protein [Fusobacterium perfoetens]MCF2612867.1 hypothetical protein [Fusobacterium perfoetens]
MILKIAGLLYIFYIVIVYLVVIVYDTGKFIRFLKDKNLRKSAIKDLLLLIILIPIMPFMVLIHFLENEFNLYL